MADQFSFVKHEHKVLPNFRRKISSAESTEDVKKFFAHTAKELLETISEGKMKFRYEDFALMPEADPPFALSERILADDALNTLWSISDLRHMICRLAESATRRHRHLEKHREKTDAKIRM